MKGTEGFSGNRKRKHFLQYPNSKGTSTLNHFN